MNFNSMKLRAAARIWRENRVFVVPGVRFPLFLGMTKPFLDKPPRNI